MLRILKWPTDKRTRLLSAAGAALLAIMCGSAFAVWATGGRLPLDLPPLTSETTSSDYGLGAAGQAGVSPSASASPRPSNSTLAGTASGVPLNGSYRTVALLGLGGFDTEVTVRNPGDTAHEGWTVVLTMPDGTAVENRSTDLVKVEQKGAIVTITPVKPTVAPSGTLTFTVRFPAVLALGKAVKDCKIDGTPCSAG